MPKLDAELLKTLNKLPMTKIKTNGNYLRFWSPDIKITLSRNSPLKESVIKKNDAPRTGGGTLYGISESFELTKADTDWSLSYYNSDDTYSIEMVARLINHHIETIITLYRSELKSAEGWNELSSLDADNNGT